MRLNSLSVFQVTIVVTSQDVSVLAVQKFDSKWANVLLPKQVYG